MEEGPKVEVRSLTAEESARQADAAARSAALKRELEQRFREFWERS